VLLAAGLTSGCYERHTRSLDDGGTPDAGISRFAGTWLIDQPFHGSYEGTLYELAPDGRFIEGCSFGGSDPVELTAVVERASDHMRCELVGPWTNRGDSPLAVESFCDDSVARTVVLDFVWEGDRPVSVEVQKVDGEMEGWSHPGFEWRWLPCSAATGECDLCE